MWSSVWVFPESFVYFITVLEWCVESSLRPRKQAHPCHITCPWRHGLSVPSVFSVPCSLSQGLSLQRGIPGSLVTVFHRGPANGSHRREEEGRARALGPSAALGDASDCGCSSGRHAALSVTLLLLATWPRAPGSPPAPACPSSPRGGRAPGSRLSLGCPSPLSGLSFIQQLCLFLSAEFLVWAVSLMEPTWSRS